MRSLVVLLALATTARADTFTSVTTTPTALAAASAFLPTTEEPVGLAVRVNLPVLGLAAGDIIRAINGHSPFPGDLTRLETGSSAYLDVLRGSTKVVIRISIPPAPRNEAIDIDDYTEHLARLREHDALVQLTRGGKPSGVQLQMMFSELGSTGDIIRSVDGVAITTPAQLADALDKAKTRTAVVVKLESGDQTISSTIHILPSAAAMRALIKKTGDSSYEIPRSIGDMIGTTHTRSARIVPAVKNGKPDGFKLYAIRPTSIYAALGLENGDTVHAVNGFELTTVDKALEIYNKVKLANAIQLEIIRRGKPLKLDYTIK